MFEITKPHKDNLKSNKKSIKIGKRVPKGALNLAYYNNNPVPIDQNIVVSSAPKMTIDHLSVSEQIIKNCCPAKDERLFPLTIPYEDSNNYAGEMFLDRIVWIDHVHNRSKYHTVVKEYEVTSMSAPESSIVVSEDGMTGILGVTNAEYTPIGWGEATSSDESVKLIRDTKKSGSLSEPNYSFPDSYYYEKDGYAGTVYKLHKTLRFIPTMSDSSVNQQLVERAGEASYITIGGVRYPKIDSSIKTQTLKGYGLMRVHGRSGGMYDGTGNSWSDPYPRHNNSGLRYAPNQIRGFNSAAKGPGNVNISEMKIAQHDVTLGLPKWPSGKVDPLFTRLSGSGWVEEWTLNWDATNACDGRTANGYYWADTFTSLAQIHQYAGVSSTQDAANNMKIPNVRQDTGGGTNFTRIDQMVLNGSPIGNMDYFYSHIIKPNAGTNRGVTTQALAERVKDRIPLPWVQPHFRDIVGFYIGKRREAISTYGGTFITAGGISYRAECDYEGTVKKVSSGQTQVPNRWKAKVTFGGTISASYTDYNGVAMYSGVATKRDSIGNVNPTGSNIRILYPNDEGVLFENLSVIKSKEIETDFVQITDMFKDNIPLFYKYRLKNKVYSGVAPNSFGFIDGINLKLVNSRNRELPGKMKYAIKLIPTSEDDVYYCDVYTSFETNIQNPIKCLYVGYNKDSDIKITSNISETIHVKPAFDRNVDFKMNVLDAIDRRCYLEIKNPSIIDDTRKKIRIEYEVKAYKEGNLVAKSAVISAICINHRYALSNESGLFVGRGQIVSPKKYSNYQTALEIIRYSADLSDSDIENCSIAVDLVSASSDDYSVNLYTASDGTTEVFAEVITDTGFKNGDEYNGVISTPGKYVYTENKIRCAYAVKCVDAREICLKQPKETDLLKDWHVDVQFGHSSVVMGFRGIKKKFVYDIPEYDTQNYGKYGRPYKDVEKERAIVSSDHIIKLKNKDIYVKYNNLNSIINVVVFRVSILNQVEKLTVEDVSISEGYVMIKETLSITDRIEVSYSYIEHNYTYRGFFERKDFIKLDVNTNKYHNFIDERISSTRLDVSSNLLNKTIYFFMRPKAIITDFTDDGHGQMLSKMAYHTLTSEVNVFPETVFKSEDGYSGDIPKFGDPVESDTPSVDLNLLFKRELKGNAETVFPDTVNIDENGFIGDIPKDGEKIHTGGNIKDEVKETLYATLTGDNSFVFPNETEVLDSSSNSHLIPKKGEKYILEGEAGGSESKEFEDIRQAEAGETFPDTVLIEEGDFYGEIPKFEEPYVISGSAPQEIEIELTDYLEGDVNTVFPPSIIDTTQDEECILYKDGEPVVVSGNPSTEIETEVTGYRESSDKNSFPNAISVVAPSGKNVICEKDGEPFVISGSVQKVPLKEVRRFSSSSSIPESITINHNGVNYNVPKTSSTREIIGYEVEKVPTGKLVTVKRTSEIVKLKHFNGSFLSDGKSWKLSEFCSGCPNDITFEFSKSVGSGGYPVPTSAHYSGPMTIPKSIINIPDIDSYRLAFIHRHVENTNKVNEMVASGNYKIEDRDPMYEGQINGEIARYVSSAMTIKSNPKLHDALCTGVMHSEITLKEYKDQENKDKPIFGDYIVTYSKTVEVSTQVWKQNYKGVDITYTPDTRVFEQQYKGIYITMSLDTRLFEQKYKGVVDSSRPDTRVYGQDYEGEVISFEGTDDREFTQRYAGYLSKPGSNSISQTFTRELVEADKRDFPASIRITEDGFDGDIYKNGEATVVEGSVSTLKKDVEEKVTRDTSGGFPYSIEYNKDGYKGTLYQSGKPVQSGSVDKVKIEGFSKSNKRIVSRCEKGVGRTKNPNYDPAKFNLVDVNTWEYWQDPGVVWNHNFKEEYSRTQGEFNEDYTVKWNNEILESVYYSSNGKSYRLNIIQSEKPTIINYPDYTLNPNNTVPYTSPFTGQLNPRQDTGYTWKWFGEIDGADGRQWTQSYKGTVSKVDESGKLYKQKYKGTLLKDSDITRTYTQNYRGLIYKAVAGEGTGLIHVIEVIFAIDTNVKLKDYVDSIQANMRRVYNSLRVTGIGLVKVGLAAYGDGKVRNISFSGSQFTSDIEKVIDEFFKLSEAPTSESNTLNAIMSIANSYTFSCDSRAIVPITLNEPMDATYTFDAINLCNSKNIKVFMVTDTHDEGTKALQVISNDTNGAAGDIRASWGIHIVTAMGKAYKMGTVKVVNLETLYHKIDDEVPDEKEDLLIGTIFVRPTATFNSTIVTDGRSLGGGLIESMKDCIRHELEPESDWYLDIGYWDGEYVHENSVVIIRLDKAILEENGGNFSKEDVEKAIDKWIAAGTVPLIEYVDVAVSSAEFSKGISVESKVSNTIDVTPFVDYKVE